jgi:hypothetical protein
MFSTKAMSLRALSRAPRQARCPTARRLYATEHNQRTQETLKTSSRLTWYVLNIPPISSHPLSLSPYPALLTSPRLTSTAALGAAALYYISSSEDPAKFPASLNPDKDSRGKAATAGAGPKPVEDRHGDTVEKHSIAAHKNQNKVREGKFSGAEFKNDELKHTPGEPGGDFEKEKKR